MPLPPIDLSAEDLRALALKMGLKTEAAKTFLYYALQNVELFDNKQLDYGPNNISKFSTFGVVVRMTDKFERIAHLYRKGKRRRAVNESIKDTFRDISNYGIIALMCEEGNWPLTEDKE